MIGKNIHGDVGLKNVNFDAKLIYRLYQITADVTSHRTAEARTVNHIPQQVTIANFQDDPWYLIMTLLFDNHIEFHIRLCDPLLSPRSRSSPFLLQENTPQAIEVTTCADECPFVTTTAVAFTAGRAKATKKASNFTYDHDRHHSHDVSSLNSKANFYPLLEPIIPQMGPKQEYSDSQSDPSWKVQNMP